MSLTDKVAQFDADSNIINAWVHGPASGAGSTVSMGGVPVRTPAKLISDKDADIVTLLGNAALLSTSVGASLVGYGSTTLEEYLDEEVVQVINDIATLHTIAPTSGKTVKVKHYTSAAGGGGGEFYWDANKAKSEHNGGTVIDPTAVFPSDWTNQTQLATWFGTSNAGNGCWVRQYAGDIDVRWFGAKGDGIADDTLSIQKALDVYLNVFLSEGTYNVTQTLKLRAYCVLSGSNRHTCIIKSSVSNVTIIARHNYADVNAIGGEKIELRHLKIEDNAASRAAAYTVNFSNSNYIKFFDVWFQNVNPTGKNITDKFTVLLGSHPNAAVYAGFLISDITHCRFNQTSLINRTTDYYLFKNEFWANTRAFSVEISGGGLIASNEFVGGSTLGALVVDSTLVSGVETLKVLGNYFDGNDTISINSNVGIRVTPGTILKNPIIQGNTFWHQSAEAIRCEGRMINPIISNTYDDCDAADTGVDDVYINELSSGSIAGGTHTRNDLAPKTGLTRVNKGKPLAVVTNTVGTGAVRVSACSIFTQTRYIAATYGTASLVSVSNSDSFFGSDYIVETDALNAPTTTGTSYDDFITSGVFYFAGATSLTNYPATATGPVILVVNKINTTGTFASQNFNTPKDGKTWTRLRESSVWSAWTQV